MSKINEVNYREGSFSMDEKNTSLVENEYSIEPGQSFKVDLFRPEDAVGVARLFRAVYGDDYPIQKFLQPGLLVEENASGRTISSVARTPKGDIVGHNALFNSAPYSGIYESGSGLVLPDYRRRSGIFMKLIAHGLDVAAKKFNMELIYGESVCNHLISQKVAAGFSSVTHSIEVDLMPAQAYTREQSATGRVATILDFKTLKPKPHTVYLPAIYEETLRFLYSELDDSRKILLSVQGLPDFKTTELNVQIFSFARVARIAVIEAGADFERVFDEQEKAAIDKGMTVIQVWPNLSWPWAGRVAEALRKRGYFLGGILPRWFDEDGMLMQKVIGQPNWEEIRLYTERAKKLLELVKADWKNCKQV